MRPLAYAREQTRLPGSDELVGYEATCAVCCKSTASIVPFALGKKAGRGAHHCRLCLYVICAACHVKKRLSSISPTGALYMLPISFCVICVVAVTDASAFDIAVDKLVQKGANRGYGSDTGGSFGSSLSPTETTADRSSTADSLMGHES